MPTIKSIVIKNMRKITLLMVVIILFLAAAIQAISIQRESRQDALQIFAQVEQILDENSKELEQIQEDYAEQCLNDARLVSYILIQDPAAVGDTEKLREIAADIGVAEIHIFNKEGVIFAGTHPEYYDFSFDSGEQMSFFKPLLEDRSLELVQDVMPNTAEGKLVQYSAIWSENGEYIVQIGMEPESVLRATEKNGLSYIFSLLRTGLGYRLYAISPETEKVVGSTVVSDVGRRFTDIGFRTDQLESEKPYYANADQVLSFCLSREIGGNYVVWTTPLSSFSRTIFGSSAVLLAGLLLISFILVSAVTDTVNRTVIEQIKQTNQSLRSIQDGDLNTKIDVTGSKEFSELSSHINSMVDSLLQSSEKLEMSEKIAQQKEELERQKAKLEQQHDQLETAVKRAEAANKAKSDFLFNMSHDIRTPMNAIIGFTNLALESDSAETQREYLQNIDISSKQLLHLINDILELSRIENRRIMIETDLVDLNETCRKLCTVLSSDLKKKKLTLTSTIDIQHPHMYLDSTQYSKIFLNITDNAIKYTPNGGIISVSFRELPGDTAGTCCVETVVEDSGIGMSSEFVTHAFESFARERTSTESGVQGTGLGLAIVKNLVDMMQGTISIESRQGKGTKVTIRLPHRLGEAPSAKKALDVTDSALFANRRILLAEDIDINAMIATKLLTGKGCAVDRARDGVECVDMLLKADAGHYDLVLMDIQMPNMDGYTASQTIRAFEDKERSSIPILALTANAFPEDRDKAAASGMNGHIAKPLDPAKLFAEIAAVLG